MVSSTAGAAGARPRKITVHRLLLSHAIAMARAGCPRMFKYVVSIAFPTASVWEYQASLGSDTTRKAWVRFAHRLRDVEPVHREGDAIDVGSAR